MILTRTRVSTESQAEYAHIEDHINTGGATIQDYILEAACHLRSPPAITLPQPHGSLCNYSFMLIHIRGVVSQGPTGLLRNAQLHQLVQTALFGGPGPTAKHPGAAYPAPGGRARAARPSKRNASEMRPDPGPGGPATASFIAAAPRAQYSMVNPHVAVL